MHMKKTSRHDEKYVVRVLDDSFLYEVNSPPYPPLRPCPDFRSVSGCLSNNYQGRRYIINVWLRDYALVVQKSMYDALLDIFTDKMRCECRVKS